MFLRVFVNADDSPAGKLALAYLPALVRIAPVRIVDPRSPMFGLELTGGWQRFGRLLQTPMQGKFVNVVATSPDRWTWMMAIEAPLKNRHVAETHAGALAEHTAAPKKEATELIEGRRELYTTDKDCVRNVLIAAAPTGLVTIDEKAEWMEQAKASANYDTVIVPADTAAFYAPTRVIPVPVTDHAAMRRIILGE